MQDYPVGTGYSFVEDNKLFVKTDVEAATDGTTLMIELFNRNETLQRSPLYIVAESYGGKFAVTLALSALKAIEAGKLKLILGGDCFSFLLDLKCSIAFLTCTENYALHPFLRSCVRGQLDITRGFYGMQFS